MFVAAGILEAGLMVGGLDVDVAVGDRGTGVELAFGSEVGVNGVS